MKSDNFDNDEPIHHFEGKDLMHSCPSELTFAHLGHLSSPINISPSITISPPGMTLVLEQQMLVQGKRFCALKKTIRRFFGNKENTTIIYLNGNLTIFESLLKNYKTNNTMIINGNIYNCTIITNDTNNDSHNNGYRKDQEAEEVEYEEVKVEQKPEAKSDSPVPVTGKDYSKSPLKPLFTHPEQADFILDRMHRIMDYQTIDREKIKYLKSVCEHEVFKARIPYKDYAAEFGSEIQQPRYSFLMKDGGKYSKKELNLAFKCIFS